VGEIHGVSTNSSSNNKQYSASQPHKQLTSIDHDIVGAPVMDPCVILDPRWCAVIVTVENVFTTWFPSDEHLSLYRERSQFGIGEQQSGCYKKTWCKHTYPFMS
jgi:hypothetical protein